MTYRTPVHVSQREVEIMSGNVLRKVDLDDEYFGEGVTVLKGQVYQITWRSKVCIVYDLETFQVNKGSDPSCRPMLAPRIC